MLHVFLMNGQGRNFLNTLIQNAVSPNVDGVGAMDPGSTATVQIFKSVRLPVESAHTLFGHTVRGGVFGSQRDAASLRATDSLITKICL